VLLMPGCGPDQALERAEDVRRRVEALCVTHNGQDLGLTTVSLGLASAPDHCALDRLVETADAAMYGPRELAETKSRWLWPGAPAGPSPERRRRPTSATEWAWTG